MNQGNSSQSFGSYAAEAFSNLFEPDVVLPSQFLEARDKGLGGGERKLMAALLSDGIEAYISHCTSTSTETSRTRSDAQEWVETRDYNYVFSFDMVCQCLGINPEYLRLGLSRYIDAHRKQQSMEGDGVKGGWRRIRRPRKM